MVSLNKSITKFIIIILNILVIVFIILLANIFINANNANNANNRNISKFENTDAKPTQTISMNNTVNAKLYSNGKLDNEPGTCTSNNDLVNVCINYDSCCSETGSKYNNECFCNHPFTLKCKQEYDNCIASNPKNNEDCNLKLKQCCIPYNSIPIKNSNFKQLSNRNQTNNLLCKINSINNMEQKCMELCQTNTQCKAFNLDVISCTLFNEVDKYYDDTAKNNSNATYFIKK